MVKGTNTFATAVKSLWSGVCTVTVLKNETNEDNGRAEAKEVDLCTNEPCRISFDDVITFSASKRDLKLAAKQFEEYLLKYLGLEIKPNHHIKHTDREAPDMMGFVVSKECTTIRSRTFVRARRALIRAWQRMQMGLPIFLQNARRIVSYRGNFKHTNSQQIAKVLHLKEVHRAARKVISNFAKGAKKNDSKSVLHRTPGQYQIYEPALG